MHGVFLCWEDLCQIICYRIHCCAKTLQILACNCSRPFRSGLGKNFASSKGNRQDSSFRLELFFRDVWITLKDFCTGRLCRLPPLQAWEGEEAPIHTGASPVHRTLWWWVCPGTCPGANDWPSEEGVSAERQNHRLCRGPTSEAVQTLLSVTTTTINIGISLVQILESMLAFFSCPGTLQWMKRAESTEETELPPGCYSFSCIRVGMKKSWKHAREVWRSWLPSGDPGWMWSSSTVLESWLVTQDFLALKTQSVPLSSAPSKRKYINAPVQEKLPEAQTLKQFISETQFVPYPIPTDCCIPLCKRLGWNSKFTVKTEWRFLSVSFPEYLPP